METIRKKRNFIAGFCVLVLVAAAGAGAFLLVRDDATANSGPEITASTANDTRSVGPSGLRVPRYVSLKTDRVNVRRGPSTAHQVIWVFARQGLPVEIIAEYEHWRRVRDSEGEEGWVYHSLLSGRRTGLVAPWREDERLQLLSAPEATANAVAVIESGVVGSISRCTGQWCRFEINGLEGWLEQELLWGVYPNERID